MGNILLADWTAPGAGLANGRRAHLTRPDQFITCQNMIPRAGVMMKRGGTVQQGSALEAATVRWLHHAYGANASTALRIRMALCGNDLYYKTVAGAWTSFATGLTTGTFPQAVTYKDQVWWCDGTNTPLKITIADPAVDTSWGGLPSGINPRWVVLHKNRLYYGGDITTPNLVYMTGPGTPETTATTDFYAVPDDQRGFFPRIATNLGEGIGLFAQDYLCYLTGTGPLSHRIYHLPKGAACLYWRTVVDMGGYTIFLTERGPFAWDGHTVAEPLDPYGEINFGDFNFATVENTWACRYGDYYMLGFQSKGNSVAVDSGTAYTRSSTTFSAVTRLTRSTTGDSQSGHFLLYDTRLKQWSGPHSGDFLCAAWEEALYGDTQDLWVGDSTSGGKVGKFDQAGTYTDYTAPYECVLRTGSLAPTFSRGTVERVKLQASAQKTTTGKVSVAVWYNGSLREPAAWTEGMSLNPAAPMGGDPAVFSGGEAPVEDFVVREAKRPYNAHQKGGYEPQIEISENSSEAFVVHSVGAEVTTEEK